MPALSRASALLAAPTREELEDEEDERAVGYLKGDFCVRAAASAKAWEFVDLKGGEGSKVVAAKSAGGENDGVTASEGDEPAVLYSADCAGAAVASCPTIFG